MSVRYRDPSDALPRVEMPEEEPQEAVQVGTEEIFVAPPPQLKRQEAVTMPSAVVVDGKVTNPDPLPVPAFKGRGVDKKPRKKKTMTPAALEALKKARAKAKANREARKAKKAKEALEAKEMPPPQPVQPKAVKRVTMKHAYDESDYADFLAYREFQKKRKHHQTKRSAAKAPMARPSHETRVQPPAGAAKRQKAMVKAPEPQRQPMQRQPQRRPPKQQPRQQPPSMFAQIQSQNPWDGLFS